MKILLSVVLMMTLVMILAAQEVEEFNATDTDDTIKLEDTKAAKPKEDKPTIELEDLDEDTDGEIIKVNYKKKSAALAMVASAVIPGVGAVYGDYTSWTGYASFLVEVALWVGYSHFQNEGLKKESDYEDYADIWYSPTEYIYARDNIIAISDTDIYDTDHFRLQYEEKNQHYYEDIGKYNKYVFGWKDWYLKYGDGDNHTYDWEFDNDGKWIGNFPTDGTSDGQYDAPYSSYRAKYIEMRKDAEDSYTKADYFTWGVLFNHIAAILDAYRVTRTYNVEYLSKAPAFQFHVQPIVCNERMTPMLMISRKF